MTVHGNGKSERYGEPLLRRLGVLRPLPFVLLACFWLAPRASVGSTRFSDGTDALVAALAARGLDVPREELTWLDPPPGPLTARYRSQRAVFRGRLPGELFDIYLTRAKLSPEGGLLAVSDIYNLTDTSAADERELRVNAESAAWIIGGGERVYSVHLADLSGDAPAEHQSWTWLMRVQRAITDFQRTGSVDGIGRRSFKLEPAAETLELGLSDDELFVLADDNPIRIPLKRGQKIDGQRYLVERPHHPIRPGNLSTWAIDRLRALPWFGQDGAQWVKAIGFGALDLMERALGSVTFDSASEEIADELGELGAKKPTTYTDPETGWPPPPMKLVRADAIEGEGKWVSLADDPYVRSNPAADSPFVFSFIRTDKQRRFSRVFVLLWDPRQVELHAVSGTEEPKTATGETGDGLVPREPKVMRRLLGAFNGGFQATHGEYGMMAERTVYLPPKPYAATVAMLDDGSTGFGTWPDDATVPENIVSFRQNMTPLIQDGVVNPYQRAWWGGTPPGWEDESRTIRSGICMTREGFIAYLYGSSLDEEHLRLAAEAARCSYAIHLDMNPGHTGLEFYRADEKDRLPEPTSKLDPHWHARGDVPEMPGWRFMARRLIKYTALMHFPRYIGREARDFFYLTLRPILPGKQLPKELNASGDAGQSWITSKLPQHGWPFALALSTLTPDPTRMDAKVRLAKFDARVVRPSRAPKASSEVVVAFERSSSKKKSGLWWTPRGFRIASADDEQLKQERAKAQAELVAMGDPLDSAPSNALAAFGVDDDEMALYIEIVTGHDSARDRDLLASVLSRLGCEKAIVFERSVGLAIGGERDLSGHPVRTGKGSVSLIRKRAPGARRIFEETPVVPPATWAPLQRKRIRYFRKLERAE